MHNSCKIPECDSPEGQNAYRPDWLRHAIPIGANGKPSQCLRYAAAAADTSGESNSGLTCPAWSFNQSATVECDEFVFATDEVTLVNEVGNEAIRDVI